MAHRFECMHVCIAMSHLLCLCYAVCVSMRAMQFTVCACTARYLSFHPMAQCVVRALRSQKTSYVFITEVPHGMRALHCLRMYPLVYAAAPAACYDAPLGDRFSSDLRCWHPCNVRIRTVQASKGNSSRSNVANKRLWQLTCTEPELCRAAAVSEAIQVLWGT